MKVVRVVAAVICDDYDDDDEYLPIDNEPTEAAEEKAADDAE